MKWYQKRKAIRETLKGIKSAMKAMDVAPDAVAVIRGFDLEIDEASERALRRLNAGSKLVVVMGMSDGFEHVEAVEDTLIAGSDSTVWEEFDSSGSNDPFRHYDFGYINELEVQVKAVRKGEDHISNELEGLVRLLEFMCYEHNRIMGLSDAIKELQASKPKTPGLILKQRQQKDVNAAQSGGSEGGM